MRPCANDVFVLLAMVVFFRLLVLCCCSSYFVYSFCFARRWHRARWGHRQHGICAPRLQNKTRAHRPEFGPETREHIPSKNKSDQESPASTHDERTMTTRASTNGHRRLVWTWGSNLFSLPCSERERPGKERAGSGGSTQATQHLRPTRSPAQAESPCAGQRTTRLGRVPSPTI